MNIYDAQREAIEQNAANKAEFDIVATRIRARWEDAIAGTLRIIGGPPELINRLIRIDVFAGESRFSIENFTIPTNDLAESAHTELPSTTPSVAATSEAT